jgi:hypothetical protein
MSDPGTPRPKDAPKDAPTKPVEVDPETGTDPDGTPVENPSG